MKGLKAIFVLLVMTVSSGAVVITAPGMEPSSLTREKLIVIYISSRDTHYKLIVECLNGIVLSMRQMKIILNYFITSILLYDSNFLTSFVYAHYPNWKNTTHNLLCPLHVFPPIIIAFCHYPTPTQNILMHCYYVLAIQCIYRALLTSFTNNSRGTILSFLP